ncbi:MAG: CDP-alcohol phosphatidyltransferase family protein [Dehalococcoidia bacterium]|nr:CDP-alcohol phosphatidyltransferase family protein [Dehalococcoidia bacterium]
MTKTDWRRNVASYVTVPVARTLARTSITPDILTWFGFVLTCGAAVLVLLGLPQWGGLVMLIAASMDMFDGALARQTGRVSRFGAVLDSTLDRLSEGVVLTAIIYAFAVDGEPWYAALAGATLLLSFTVSYIRARAESMGITLNEGWFTRSERVIVMALGLILNLIIIALAVIAVLSLATSAQRLYTAWRRLRTQV